MSLLILAGLGRLAEVAVDRAKAQAAADMAALAGVVEGREGAAELAERNGAVVVGYVEADGVTFVSVVVDGVGARASATFEWGGGAP